MEGTPLHRTALYDWHKNAGGKFTAFSGYEMPVYYDGISREHQAVRQSVGLFDVSHMGVVDFSDDEAPGDLLPSFDALFCADLAKVKPWRAKYTLMLNDQGGVIDDCIVYNRGDDRWRVIFNAGNKQRDIEWIQERSPKTKITHLDDVSLIAVQGPAAIKLLEDLLESLVGEVGRVSMPKRFRHADYRLSLSGDSVKCMIARTGYTGEDGVEIVVPNASAQSLWQELIAQGAVPCGLGARDTLRLEAGLMLHGQDITPEINPIQADLAWCLDKDSNYIGKDSIDQVMKAGPSQKLIGMALTGKRIARTGCAVMKREEGNPEGKGSTVGYVTSGTFSPTLQQSIAIAYVDSSLSDIDELYCEIRHKHVRAQCVDLPFYTATKAAPTVEIYTKDSCGYCRRALALLDKKNVSFTQYRLEESSELFERMVKHSAGGRTVPQIFIGGQHIGGCDDLFALEQRGALDLLLSGGA